VIRQTVWLSQHATHFEAECEACRADRWSLSTDAPSPHVEGSLRADADLGFASCRRGHRLVVRRIVRPAVLSRF
jgi:hypothetical protein